MQGPAKPLYGGSIPPLASNFYVMILNYQNIQLLLVRNTKVLIALLVVFLFIIISILSLNHFRDKKRAKISADIAVGIDYLEEENKEIALYYFEKAFNESDGLQGVLAGVGVIKSLEGKSDFDEKSNTIFSIIKNYKAPKFINMFVLSNYLQNLSKYGKTDDVSFKKFESYAKKHEHFNQSLEAINLNLKK